MAMAFQRHDTDQIVDGIADVRPAGRWLALRDTVKPLQTHHMVDAQAAGMAHVGSHQFDEWPVAMPRKGDRIEGRQPPVLTRWIENIGRRADFDVIEEIGLCPGFRSSPVAPHRKIAIEADAHSGSLRALFRVSQLLIGDPLQPVEEVDLTAVIPRKLARLGRGGRAKFLWPLMPMGTDTIRAGEMYPQHLK
jgi:hypothetical protein